MNKWRNWKITDEQAEQIRNGEIEAVNRFYFDNLKRIRQMACNYSMRNPKCRGFVQDMLQTLYIDLTYFKTDTGIPVTDGITLSCFVYASFRISPFGGLLYCSEYNKKMLSGGALRVYDDDVLSLDKPFGNNNNGKRHQDDGNERTLGDVVPSYSPICDEDHTEDCKAIVWEFLSPRQKEYFALFIEGYGYTALCEKIGNYGSTRDDCNKKLRNNKDIILKRLDELGINIEQYRNMLPYNPKTDRVYKLSPEKRARAAELKRLRTAKQKAKQQSAS